MIESLEHWIYTVAPHAPYWIVFGVLVGTGFGLPIPEDVVVLIAGYLCGIQYAHWWLMLPMVFFTIVAADAIIFFLGRRYGHHVARVPVLRRYVTPGRLLRMERQLQRHGGKFIFVARFMPGVRTAAMFAAGVLKVRYGIFVLYDGAAALLTIPAVFFAAYFGADHIQAVKRFVEQSQLALGGIAIAIVAAVVVYWVRRKRKRKAKLDQAIAKRKKRRKLARERAHKGLFHRSHRHSHRHNKSNAKSKPDTETTPNAAEQTTS